MTTSAPISLQPSLPRPLAAVVLLAGAVRPSDLRRAAGRPILDLPLHQNHTLAAEWLRRVEELRAAVGRPDLPLVVTANANAGMPQGMGKANAVSVRMDSEEPRGSGGALRDLAMEHDREACFLVASGHSLLRSPLAAMWGSMARFGDDIVINTDSDNRPTGLFLIRCGALVGLPARGFVDLKEQAIPQLASQFKVRVVGDSGPTPISIRSLPSYYAALRAFASGERAGTSLPTEDWLCTFTLTEAGAIVDPTARLHDSVVLSGGRVGAKANVVRSLVGPGGIVAAGAEAFDELMPLVEQKK